MKKKKVIELLKRAIQSATFENADFSNELKEKTKLYRDTWIISPIKEAIELIIGDAKK